MTKKPTINTVTSGWTSADTLNSNLEALRDAFENTISRDGSTPNSMEADLDLNDYDLLNVGEVDATTLRIGGQLVNIADLVSVEETYLNSMSLAYIYATVAELVASTDTYTTFSENDYVIANGYLYQVAASVATDHNLSNAGGVKYYVRSVNNTMYVDAFNLAGSGDETDEIESMCQYASDAGAKLIWPTDVTYTYDELRLTGDHDWEGARLYSNKVYTDTVDAIKFARTDIGEVSVTANFDLGDNSIVVDSATGIQVGDFMRVETTRLIPSGHRGVWTEGQLMRVKSISGTTITFDTNFVFSFVESIQTGTVDAISGDRLTLTLSNPASNQDARFVRKKLRITSGAASGEENYILTASGSTVYQDTSAWSANLQVGDSYSFESIATATIYRPVTVKLIDCQFTRDRVTAATDGDEAVSGIDVDGAYFTMKNCLIDGFAESGLSLSRCYEPLVEDTRIQYCNRAYGTGGGHGYGVVALVCHAPYIKNVQGYANRRTVDFSGSRGYTTYGVAEKVTNVGGGPTYTGSVFFPASTVQNSVAGSHGAGYGSKYINCMGQDVFTGHMMRSQKEVVENYQGFGYGYYGARQAEGGYGAKVMGLVYNDQVTMADTGNYVRSADTDLRMAYAMHIEYRDDFVFSEPIVVSGVRANSLISAVVFVEMNSYTTIRNLHILDNNVTCYPDSADTETDFRILGFDDDINIEDCVLRNNYFRVLDSYVDSAMVISIAPDSFAGAKTFATVVDSGKLWIDDKVYVSVPNQTVVRVPIKASQAVLLLNIMNSQIGTGRPRATNVGLADRNANDHNSAGSTLTSFEIVATYPTAYTDATASYIAINLDRSEGQMSFVNNQGNGHVFVIQGL